MSMPLYSSDTLSIAHGGAAHDGANREFAPGVKTCACTQEAQSWCYLFVHHMKAEAVCNKIKARFPVFVHRNAVHRRSGKTLETLERPTVSGLIFVQGQPNEVQSALAEHFPGIWLVKDCATARPAMIPDDAMQLFMQTSLSDKYHIRILPKPFDHYAEGHPLVRVTSGILAGLEGYVLRLSRQKNLVIASGTLTIALSGIWQEDFEEVERAL